MKHIKFIFISLLLSTNANAIIIGFDDLEYSDNLVHTVGGVYTQDGFNIFTDISPEFSWSFYGSSNSNYAGSAGIFTNGGTGTGGYIYYRESPGADTEYFNISSVDIARAYMDNYASFSVTFYGQFYDGRPNVSQTFFIDGSSNTFETFYFNEEFKGIMQLFWYSGGNPQAQFDNFNVSVVPIPAPIILFCSGLLGLIGFIKKNNAH